MAIIPSEPTVMYKQTIATFLSWSSFSPWERWEIVGAVLVSIGCAGEMLWLFRKGPQKEAWLAYLKFEDRKTMWERIFAILVAIGVVIELITLPHGLKETANIALRVEELRQGNDALEVRLWPRAKKLRMEDTALAISGFKGKEKPRIDLLYPGNDSEAWQLARRIAWAIGGLGWKTSVRGEQEDDIPPVQKPSPEEFGLPLELRFSLSPEGGFVVIANPQFVKSGQSPWFLNASQVTNVSRWGTNFVLVPHTDNPVDSIWAALMAGGLNLAYGSITWDQRLPTNVIKVIVPQKYW